MTTVSHRHSRPHHNDEPLLFPNLDREARDSAAEVIATATSAGDVTDLLLVELSGDDLVTAAPTPDEYMMDRSSILGALGAFLRVSGDADDRDDGSFSKAPSPDAIG